MYTGRGVSASDLNWWATEGANITYEEAVALFANSADAAAKYPFFQAPQTADKLQYIAEVFANLYNIDINDTDLVPTEELDYWINWLSLSPDNYLDFPNALNNASAAAGLTDRLEALTNKTDVSLSFAEVFSSVGVNTFTPEQYAEASEIISGVDGTIESVLAAEAQIIELAAGVNVFTIAEAEATPNLPPLYTISDSADNLIAGTADPVVVGATAVIADQSPAAPLSVEDAETLLATADSLAPGVTWDILDSATAVLDGGDAVSGAASVGITDTFVDVATAEQLVGLDNFDGIYAIEDTSAAILANTEVAGGATSVTLTDPEVAVTVADAETLQGLGNFEGPYNIEDTSAAILANTEVAAGATSVTLTDPEVAVTVADAETLQGLGNFEGPYNISDTAANILAAETSPALLAADSVVLSNPSTPVTVAEAGVLQGLGNFEGPYNIADTSANILAAATSPVLLGADTIILSNPSAPVTVAGAETLQGLGNFEGPYNILDTSANILAAATSTAVLGADSVVLSNPFVGITVADAEVLQGLGNFGGAYNILDTSANILAAATSPAVLGADSVTLSNSSVPVTVADAEVLQGLGNFEGPYAIEDTSANILGAATSPAVLDATSVTLSDPDVAITVGDAKTLQDLGNFGGPYNIEDTSAAILGNATSAAVLNAESVILSDPGVPVSVAGAQTLQGLGNFEGPYHIEDTSANILAAATTPAVLDATSVELSNPGVPVSVAGAQTLQGLGNFEGPYHIEDTSANILAAATTPAVLDATSVELSNPGVPVTVDGAETLQGLGNFVGPYNIEDTSAAILAAATTGAVLDADSVTLSDPGVPVTVDGAETLQGLGNFVGPYHIQDTSANILAAATTPAVLNATSVELSNAGTPVTIAEAEVLLGIPGFDGVYAIEDTSANILADASSPVVLDATSVSLSDPGVGVTVAGAETLQGLGNFDGIYAIADTLANLTDAPSQLLIDSTGYELTNAPGNLGIVSDEQQILVQNAINAADFTFTTVDITASRPQVNEGSVTEILVTLSEAQATDTTVTFFLTPGDPTAPDTGTDESNTNDFIGGQFNPITVIIPAGELSASVDYSPFLDGIAELTEGFSVVVTISGSAAGAVFDLGGLAILDGPGDGSIVNLTIGNDIVSATTFIAAPELAIGGLTANTLNTGDRLTGIGEDTSLTVSWVASTFGSNLVQLQMKGVEDLNVTLLQDDLFIFANNPGGVTVTDVKNLKASGSVNGDFSIVDLQSTLETITVQNYFFGDDVNVTIGDPFLAGDDDVLGLTLDQVTASKGGNTRVNVSDFSGTGGYENLLIQSGVSTTSKGITNTVEIDGIVAVEFIGITGNENLTLATSLISSTTVVDASNFEGDLNAFVDTPGGDMLFLSGSGDDVISISRDALTAGHILDGGAGDDLLTITGDAFSAFDAGHTVIGGEGDDFILLTGVADGPIAGHVVNGFDIGGGVFAEVGGDGDDIIIIEGDAIGSSAGHVVFGGKGEDLIDISGNAIAINSEAGHVVDAGDDDDIVLITGNADASTALIGDVAVAGHSVDGGGGGDIIDISGDAIAFSALGDAFAGHSVDGGDGDDIIDISGDAQAVGGFDFAGHTVNGGEGNDVIDISGDVLSFGGHFVTGGSGDDEILLSGDGDHIAFGDDGDDLIVMTGIGDVSFFGGDGEDTLVGAAGDDVLSGGDDDDFLIGGDGDDTLTGGEGDDTMFGDEGADLFIVDAGIDFIGDLGNSTNPDDDRFQVSVNAIANIAVVGDFVATGGINGTWNKGTANLEIASPLGLLVDLSDANTIATPPPTFGFTVVGNVGDDTIIGSLDDDTLSGGIGEDEIDGGLGDDIISGGADDDELVGDLRLGGAAVNANGLAFAGGNDTIDGGTGEDEIAGDLWIGAGNITITNSSVIGGNDSILGGADDDEITGDVRLGAGAVTITGSSFTGGNDFIDGGSGNDEIAGDLMIGAGSVTITNSTLTGGIDSIVGGIGSDEIAGDVMIGAGTVTITNSTLTGGDDIIEGGTGDGGNNIFGDLSISSGGLVTLTDYTLFGGNDLIVSQAINREFLFGDAFVDSDDLTINGLKFGKFDLDTGDVTVGNDFIIGGDAGNNIFGDLFFRTDNLPTLATVTKLTLIGGNDTILGGDGEDLLVGDFAFRIDDGADFGDANLVSLSNAAKFSLAGGEDLLDGGKGDDIYYGGGGIDTILLGNNITDPFGEGLNGNNELWYMNGASENAARNGANVDVITGFNTINDQFVFASGAGNFLANLNLQATPAETVIGWSPLPFVPLVPSPIAVNGTTFNIAPTVTNAFANNLNNVFEAVTNTTASSSGGAPVFVPQVGFPFFAFAGVTASNLQMQQINVTSGALAGRQFLFINDGVGEVNTQDDFLAEITGITGTFGGAIPLTENFEVRQFNV
ncbi:calcium-binding protein [Synechocystis sp. PCC 6714]|uniref:beta strand repeat-containing protein n=1 Tax=Synechocystis sp. (strain PCC 6714) TaxID=1147 RepID=UPI0004D1FA07|nr:calcium-binding protein [Synechocystis sp. PCC 6714]AIE75320.1 Hemolysin [Synechocystis sp. PCC 6714]